MTERLGAYVDAVYTVVPAEGGSRITSDRAFLLFACEVGRRSGGLQLFGRTVHADVPSDYVLPADVALAELPYYRSLKQVGEVVRAAAGTVRGMWRGLADVHTVWVFGPYPFSPLLIALAVVRRRRVVLGVRQDTMSYYRARLPSGGWTPALAPAWLLDRFYRLLARRVPATVVGEGIARTFGDRPNVLAMTVSLVPESQVATGPADRSRPGETRLLTIGRLEPEKNPLLLVDALAALEQGEPGRYSLTWVGRGSLEEDVRRRAAELGLAERITFVGYVPFGPELLDLYRGADVFVHVSHTEGMPQVLVEALACATPIVATDVGGVAAALDGGRAGLLVPRDDRGALVGAVRQLAGDRGLRKRLVAHGLELARAQTLEAEAARVAAFIASGRRPRRAARRAP